MIYIEEVGEVPPELFEKLRKHHGPEGDCPHPEDCTTCAAIDEHDS